MTFREDLKIRRPKGSYPEPKFNPESEVFNLGFVVGEKRSTPLSPSGKEAQSSAPGEPTVEELAMHNSVEKALPEYLRRLDEQDKAPSKSEASTTQDKPEAT